MDDDPHPHHPEGDEDDGPVPMTTDERRAWAYLIAVVLTSGTYVAVIAGRLRDQPVAEISWAVPMLWTIGASILLTLVLTIVLTVASTVRATVRTGSADGVCAPGPGEVASDVRDREIGRTSGRASMVPIAVGFFGATVLAMLDADTFWIGNLLFGFGTLGAVVETVTSIRLYRRGF